CRCTPHRRRSVASSLSVAFMRLSQDQGELFRVSLTQLVIDTGGAGVVYWEPAWTSSSCKTRWGTGSSWENASFFDFKHGNEVLPAIDFMRHPYTGVPASSKPDASKRGTSTPDSSAETGKRTQP
ncbi:glycosyl hydrolase 53 family protein, partial [Xanthomonas vasicola]